MPHLHLCLIARDEAALLPACLASVQGVVDRIVVVDTGSRDRTAAIAEAAGATVVRHPWTDDFAAARQAGLAALDTGWMLVLDADERLAPAAGPALRAALDQPDLEVGLLPLHNASVLDARPDDVLSGRDRLGEPVLLARLFRLAPDLQWAGALHERLDAPGRALVRRPIDAPIVHLGYALDASSTQRKNSRNLAILRTMADGAAPLDALPFCYLARDATRAGDAELAASGAAEGWRRLVDRHAASLPLPPATVTLVAITLDQHLNRGDVTGARATLTTAAGWGLSHPNLDLLDATVALAEASSARGGVRRKRLIAAEGAARKALAARGQPQRDEVSAGATSWMASLRLGEALLLQDRSGEAIAAFQASLSALPRRLDGLPAQAATAARVGAAEALLRRDPGRALALVEPAMKAPWPDGWAVAAAAAAALHQPEEARLFAQQGWERRDAGWLAPHRRALLDQARR